jgi:hypothetical protein
MRYIGSMINAYKIVVIKFKGSAICVYERIILTWTLKSEVGVLD